MEIPHDKMERIENIIQKHEKWEEFLDFKFDLMSKMIKWDYKNTGSKSKPQRAIRYLKYALGRQDTCVTFLFRNWVWHRPEQNWTVYADKRGMALHVPERLTKEEAYQAYLSFKSAVGL